MISKTPMPLPSSPDALRDLVLNQLQKQEEKEAEWAERSHIIAQQQAVIAQRGAALARKDRKRSANPQGWVG
ncbi:hypothetical protein ACJU26_04170 [Acidithiobacillus sp. M4-SHS-6]|uniref:hypothetical protein n=1 Tax=Acidithiobacillus sp. M4-SHS-6 TaxID=3383024 RepID=UPI0039BDDE8D